MMRTNHESSNTVLNFSSLHIKYRAQAQRQWGNGHNRFKELRRRGVSEFRAAVAAGSPTGFWRMSGHPAVQAALRNHYFDSIGLARLYVPAPT